MTRIYHLARRADWKSARAVGSYRGGSADRSDGFIHFSTAARLAESAALHCAGMTDLMVLAVDTRSLGGDLRWEKGRNGEAYPHLYAPLDPKLVCWALPAPLGPDGRHQLPDLT